MGINTIILISIEIQNENQELVEKDIIIDIIIIHKRIKFISIIYKGINSLLGYEPTSLKF